MILQTKCRLLKNYYFEMAKNHPIFLVNNSYFERLTVICIIRNKYYTHNASYL